MLTILTGHLVGIWKFVVGHDWIPASVAVGAGILTAVIQSIGVPGWWLIPVVGIVILLRSVRHGHRRN